MGYTFPNINQVEFSELKFSAVKLQYNCIFSRCVNICVFPVISARDIIPLDANGLSDPYVVVSYCPSHTFPTVPIQTTKIVRKTLNPEFDESFEL